MVGPSWKSEVSLGNILTALTLVVTLAVTWGIVTNRVDAQEMRLQELTERVRAVDADAQRERVRLTELLTELRTDVRYLRAIVERRSELSPVSPTPQ